MQPLIIWILLQAIIMQEKNFPQMSNVSTNTLLALIDNEDTAIILSSTVSFSQGYTKVSTISV